MRWKQGIEHFKVGVGYEVISNDRDGSAYPLELEGNIYVNHYKQGVVLYKLG